MTAYSESELVEKLRAVAAGEITETHVCRYWLAEADQHSKALADARRDARGGMTITGENSGWYSLRQAAIDAFVLGWPEA